MNAFFESRWYWPVTIGLYAVGLGVMVWVMR